VDRLTAELVPIKNLIPDFYDSRWFSDQTTGGVVPTVEIIEPYKMIMTNTASAQGRLIWIPVEVGKTYTFSFTRITGLYRLYKKRVTFHDAPMVITNHSEAGKPDTFTFTVDETFNGFVTLRLTYGSAGVLVFENMQLEEGTVATPFEPLKLGNKKAEASYVQGNMIKPFTDLDWSFVNEPNTLVLDSYKFQTATVAGINAIIVPVVGSTQYTFSVKNPDSAIYFIDSFRDSTNLQRHTQPAGNTDNGLTFTTHANANFVKIILRGSTSSVKICTWEEPQLEEGTRTPFKPYKLGNRPAKLVTDNLVKPFTHPDWAMFAGIEVLSDTKLILHGAGNWDVSKLVVPVTVGKEYNVSADITGDISIEVWEDGVINIGSFAKETSPKSRTYTPTRSTAEIRIVNGIKGTIDSTLENLQFIQASTKQDFRPYKEKNRPAQLFPQKNLISIYDPNWTLRAGTTYANKSGSRVTWDADRDYAGVQILLPDALFVGKTITFGGKRAEGTGVLFFYKKADGSGAYIGLASYEQYRTMTIPADAYECRFYVQNNTGMRGEFWSEDLFLYLGSDTEYVPYKEDIRPAELFPQKNKLKPMTQWEWSNSTPISTFPDEYRLEFQADSMSLYRNTRFDIRRGEQLTVSAQYLSDYARVAIREIDANGVKTFLTNITAIYMSHTFTPSASAVAVEIECTVKAVGYCVFDRIQVEEGSTVTPFEPYQLGNR
jgi:hypothetical protein